MALKKRILVTGAPRSGTTWVGRIVAQSPSVQYIHEPFNISGIPCRCGVKFKYWFYYLCPANSDAFKEHLKHTLEPAFTLIGLLNLITEVARSKRIRPLFKYVRFYSPHRVLVKDPLAVFSAEALSSLFDMNLLLLIRHPAAVVNSYKALRWRHPFSHFLAQPLLMEDHLNPFREEIETFAKREYGIIDQAALLWKLIHYVIMKYQATQRLWTFVRYEDLVLDPLEGFRNIFRQLRLPYSEQLSSVIRAHHPSGTPSETEGMYSVRKNPYHALTKWKGSLSAAEVHRIRKRVEEVSSAFFTDEDWRL